VPFAARRNASGKRIITSSVEPLVGQNVLGRGL